MSAPAPRRGSFGRDVLISIGFTGLFTGIALINSVVVAQMVGAAGRGLYALLVAVLALAVPIASGGLHHAAVWNVGKGEPVGAVAVLGHLWPAFVALLSALGIGLAVLVNGGWPDQEWLLVAIAAAATLPASIYNENVRGVLLGQQRVILYNVLQVAMGGGLLLLNIWLLRYGPQYLLVSLILAYWLPALVVMLAHLPLLGAAQLPSRPLVRSSLRYGVSTAGSQLTEVGLLRLDFLLIAPFVTIEAIGLYSIADQTTGVLAMGGLVAGKMMLSQSANDPDGESSRGKLGLAVRLLLALAALGALGAAATGWFIIPFVFGEEFAPAYIGMLILLPTAAVRGAYALISTWMVGRGVVRPVLRAGVAALVTEAILCVIAAMWFGWLAVAVVRCVAVTVQLAVTYAGYLRVSGERLRWVLDARDVASLRTWARARLGR